ncbi:MAG: peptide chain release factor N(5)-glutamine methyltransferase, partial [Oscillospiraceae bacterium]|nr:peptide chain release factor N(5)-glutamine methyltransferase [Oscillospiraceae bacterium]
APGRCLDLCTGSGCIGLAIAANTENIRVVLADKSPKALAVARQNTLRNNLSRRMTCVEADVELAPPAILGTFDMIVCNPPYIPTADIAQLDRSVRAYEPMMALDGGDDGLRFYRAVTEKWSALLKPGGHLLFEVGIGQAGDVSALMAQAGFEDINIIADTAGIDRVVYGRK